MSVTVIVPTFNEAPNVVELTRRLTDTLHDSDAEILFVDDSSDDTPDIIEQVAVDNPVPVRLIHRPDPAGGLSGAVIEGIQASRSDWCLVMDGDLQHPPEMVPVLLESGEKTNADVVVASRYCRGGSSAGLSNSLRHAVSNGSIALTKAMFPNRLRNCTDPMTGFFAVRRDSLDVDQLQPRGFKILLEILTRHRLVVVEEPFVFGQRHAGESKANLAQGLRFVTQLASLRFGRMPAFALIGAIGAVANLLIMAAMLALGVPYVGAAVVAAGVTIIGNFLLQERFVFSDLRHEGKSSWKRFVQSVGFNSAETALRIPLLFLIVESTAVFFESTSLLSLGAQAVTLLAAFVVRFLFHARIVYRPRRSTAVGPLLQAPEQALADTDAATGTRPEDTKLAS